MTGVSISISVEHAAITAALRGLSADWRTRALKNIGELVVRQTKARFKAGTAPDGSRWAPLNPDYAAGKRGPGILRESGGLRDSIVWQLRGADELRVGSVKTYAAIHQLGGRIAPRSAEALVFRLGGKLVFARAVTIPARPYLGLSPADIEAVSAVIADHAAEAAGVS